MDKLAKGESEVESVEQLFTKIRNDFGKTLEEERKIEQLRTIEQGGRICMNMCRNSKRSSGGAAMREDPSLKNLNKD